MAWQPYGDTLKGSFATHDNHARRYAAIRAFFTPPSKQLFNHVKNGPILDLRPVGIDDGSVSDFLRMIRNEIGLRSRLSGTRAANT